MKEWKDLPDDEKELYLKEAEFYLKQENYNWPMKILLRLSDHGLTDERIKEYKESGWR